MLRVLLAKDLRRAWRNPLPWLINLALPLCMTALIGLAFGGKSDGGALGRIRFALVDEDDSALTQILRGAAGQREGGKYLEPVLLDRDAAMAQIMDNQLSAALIIPTNFTRNYLTGREAVSIELIKNPAQSIHPAVLEELLGVVVTALNALARNFQSEFPDWHSVVEGQGDYRKVAGLIERAGNKLQTMKEYVYPPLVSYSKATGEAKSPDQKGATAKSGPTWNLFGYLLLGMAGMFLLFLASNAMTDLPRELRQRTFERYHTLHQGLLPFVTSKLVFSVVFLALSSMVLLGGGALMFRIHWPQPAALSVLTFGYACFASGLMAVLVALIPDERRAGALNTITAMALGLAGGCAFPPQGLPTFLREHITPLLPSFWFVDTGRNLLSGGTDVPWIFVSLKLLVTSALLIGLAALLLRRRFKAGLRV